MTNTKDEIKLYLRCKKCYEYRLKEDISVGRTDYGMMIWCKTHQEPVAHLPYEWPDEIQKCQCEDCKKVVE